MNGFPPGGDRRNPDRIDRRQNPALSGHLELLAKMSSHLAVSLNIDETVKKALDLIVHYVNAEAGSMFILENNGNLLSCKASVGPIDICGITLHAGEGIAGQCVMDNCSRIVHDVGNDPHFDPTIDGITGFHTRSIMCAPMNVQADKIGAIELINKKVKNGMFADSDLMMLQTLASAAALAIRNARMAEDLVLQERVNRDLELAAKVQRSLLPPPRPAPFPVCGINLPAHGVSGDFYDFYELADGRICFSLGDVSGKGMDAAILMAKTASLFRCLGKTNHKPSTLLATINRELYETATHGMFVTMTCGVFDPATGEVQMANAGHEPPLLHEADGTFTPLPASAPPLGIMPMLTGKYGIKDEIFRLNGRTLYIFTDGVTEGRLGNGNRLTVAGLTTIISDHAGDPADVRIDAVVSHLKKTDHTRHDDITLLAVEDINHASRR
jgi:sigma-B regulation protein RsbU (phosphoserine phosphatase)